MTVNISRRAALVAAAALTSLSTLPRLAKASEPAPTLPASLKRTAAARIALPYAEDALSPVISAQTVGIHYGRHHKAYADKLTELTEGTKLADAALEDIVAAAAGDQSSAALFHAAAQVWNHNFYWQSLTPEGQAPSGRLKLEMEKAFGSVHACIQELGKASAAQFGSGWGWLVWESGGLKAVGTSNADVPFLQNQVPLLTIDVWEHAYYLDYQNRRPDYVAALLGKTANWSFASANLGLV